MINSLYVHIPFCVQKCLYCDFNSYTAIHLQDIYIEALLMELSNVKQASFNTIFVGGGTPTILSLSNLEKLLKGLTSYVNGEYTFECNPGTLDVDKLKLMKSYKVNRLSIGLQAVQDRLLKKLGRIHSFKDFLESYKNAEKCGFENINFDLMFGIPDQTLLDWKETLRTSIELSPKHISCYSLIVEEDTPFSKMHEKGLLKLADEDIERQMYYLAVDELKDHGYERYEISNFAQSGYECRHNITYWKNEEYYGIGAGAHSYIKGIRYSNYVGIEDYIEGINQGNPIADKNKVYKNDEISEFMFLGLRMSCGINKNDFKERFNEDLYISYGKEIEHLIENSLLRDDGLNIKLTDKGIDLSNQVFVELLK